MNKKISILGVVLIIIFLIIFGLLSTGGKRTDIVLIDYSVSEDGRKLDMKVSIASSMGYVRTMKEKQQDNKKYITFYSTFGLNSRIGAKHEYTVDLSPECDEIYFNAGKGEYKLILKRNVETNIWERNK